MSFKALSIVLCLGLCACHTPPVNAHADAPEPADTERKEEKAEPQLTKDQLLQLVEDARAARKQQLLTAIQTYSQQVEAMSGNVAAIDAQQKLRDLVAKLKQNAEAIQADRYVAKLAGLEPVAPDSTLLKTEQEAFAKAIDTTIDNYSEAISAVIRKDGEHGYIGQWVIDHLDQSVDTELMSQLMDFYWHHGNLDSPPATFERIIQLSYRYVQVEPDAPEIYTNAAWLLWSRWVSWTQAPDTFPKGKGDDETAIAFLLKGSTACKDNAAYHYDAAMTVWGLARHHNEKYFDFILAELNLAEKVIKKDETWLHTRIRLTLGHTYRHLKQLDKAKKAYESVLQVDPENEVAKRILKEMEEEALAGQQQI